MSKKVLVTSGAGINSKPRTTNYKEMINKKSAESLKRYITNLEDNGITSEYKESCYAYAKARYLIVSKNEGNEIIAKLEREARSLEKNIKDNQSNSIIRKKIITRYEDLYKDGLLKFPEKKRKKKIHLKSNTLNKIDFVNGEIMLPGNLGSASVKMIYLIDKGVILLKGLSKGQYVFFYQLAGKNTDLSTVTSLSIRENVAPEYANMMDRANNKVFRKWIYEPILSHFSFGFFRDFIFEFYSKYEKRNAKGTEKTNIPCCL